MKSKKYKFITIRQNSDMEYNGKHLYTIYNNKSDEKLGYLVWYKQWRQYVFAANNELCVFNKDCLRDIIDFMEKEAE